MTDTTMTLVESMPASIPFTEPIDLVVTTPDGVPLPLPPQEGCDSRNWQKHRRSATVGYIAPKFDGKQAQMVEG
jgi:hypothetical protein